jgi:tetratricopeptide (TPR) repeat protein
LGVLYAKRNRLDDAMMEYMAAIKLDPTHKDAMFNLAAGYEAIQDLTTAAEYYKKLTEIDGTKNVLDEYAYHRLSEIYAQMKDTETSAHYITLARELGEQLHQHP